VIDDKCSIINLTDEVPTNSCCSLFTDRATYILLAIDSKLSLSFSPGHYLVLWYSISKFGV
jgi:hypothetical protein